MTAPKTSLQSLEITATTFNPPNLWVVPEIPENEEEITVDDVRRLKRCDIPQHTSELPCDLAAYPDSKLILPEYICTRTLQRLSTATNRSTMRRRLGASPRHAHALIETALSYPPHEKYGDRKSALIRSASEELCRVGENKDTPDKLRIESDILSAYIPAYRARAEGMSPSRDIMSNTYKNLTAILRDYPDKYPTLEAVANTVGICAQAEITALLMRTSDPNYFLWPSSYREEEGTPKQLNHDLYNIRGQRKVPLQIKFNDSYEPDYDPRVTVIFYSALGFGKTLSSFSEQAKNNARGIAVPSLVISAERWDAWAQDDPENRAENQRHHKSLPADNGFTPFVPHVMTHALTGALISEAHHGYMGNTEFSRIEAMTRYLMDCVDLSYAGPKQ